MSETSPSMVDLIDHDRPAEGMVYPRRSSPRPTPPRRQRMAVIRDSGWTGVRLDGQLIRVRDATLGHAAAMMIGGESLGLCGQQACRRAARAGNACRHVAALLLAEHGLQHSGGD